MEAIGILFAILTLVTGITGVYLGFCIPVRRYRRPGFVHGVALCFPVISSISLSGGYLFGALGYKWFGQWGCTLGAGIGCFLFALAGSSVAGFFGHLVYRLTHRRKEKSGQSTLLSNNQNFPLSAGLFRDQ